jgi:AcrR family transcriptional regulator
MPRPRNDSVEPSGRQRIRDAFWGLYLKVPFEKITVKEICELAGCNKTTFYYHFTGIENVLREIEDACMPKDAPDMVAELMRQGEEEIPLAEYLSKHGERFDMLCHLLSSKGDPAFSRRVKDTMSKRWCEAFNIVYEELSAHDRLLMEFVMGGTTSLLASYGDGRPLDFNELIGILDETLMPHFKRILERDSIASDI